MQPSNPHPPQAKQAEEKAEMTEALAESVRLFRAQKAARIAVPPPPPPPGCGGNPTHTLFASPGQCASFA